MTAADRKVRLGDTFGLAICIGVHVVADLLLVGRVWMFEVPYSMYAALALPLSQCSLIALWAAATPANLLLRFASPLVGMVLCWTILARTLPWGVGEPASAGWAVMVVIQMIMIVVLINLYRRMRGAADSGGKQRSRFAFDLRTLILWTTAIAIGLGIVQYGRVKWRWTAAVADWEYLDAMPIIGAFHAVVAVLWLWSLAIGSWQWRCGKFALSMLLVPLLAIPVTVAANTMIIVPPAGMIARSPSIEYLEIFAMAAGQSIFIAGSLALVLLCSRKTVPRQLPTSPVEIGSTSRSGLVPLPATGSHRHES